MNKQNSKKRKRKIIWFNPPYSKNIKTNVGKIFKYLVNKHFGSDPILKKVFNKNSLKLSYRAMPNLGNIISNHNK